MIRLKYKARPATPDPDEGLLFARYVDEAAEGFFGLMLSPNSGGITAAAFMEPGRANCKGAAG